MIGCLLLNQCVLGQSYKDIVVSNAKAGNLESQKFLARIYFEGTNPSYPKNIDESFRWLSLAAAQGDAESQYALYKYYKEGLGCDKEVRMDLLKKAAEQHYPMALADAGNILSSSNNESDIKKGQQLLIEAYNAGIDDVIPVIAANYIKLGNYYLGNTFFNEGIEKCNGSMQAMSYRGMSWSYRDGLGVPKDIKKAHKMIDKAISICSNEASFYEDKGILFLTEGNMEMAKKMWNKTLESSTTYALQSQSELARAMNHSVDYGIPIAHKQTPNTYAIIIANENYKRVPNVPHAINDGRIFQKYLTSTFGIPEDNIEYLEDASLNDIKYAISNIAQRCEAFRDQVSVIVYYAGHGVPDDKTAEAFLLPVDGFGTDPSSGLNLDDFYASLSAMPAKSVVVLLDACFSGAKRDGGMLMATRGITIKPKMHVPDGKLIVFSATSNEETAFPIEEQKHGLFTYTLLRKIQETGGDITWGELADYVTDTVKNRSIDLNGKLQTPTVSVSSSIRDSWRDLKIR